MEFDNQMLNEPVYDDGSYMDEDQYTHEDDLNDGFEPGYAIMSDSSSSVASRPRRNKTKDSYESADKNFHKLIRTVKYKRVEIPIYTSPVSPGACIRDAITGTRYKDYRIGSINEHQFFKVKFATGEFGQDSGCCFFDSPEQYEKHMYENIDVNVKNEWADKCASVRKMYE
jgi:hypothetical protein